MGLRQSGGAHAHLRRRIDEFGIDTGHFGPARNTGRPPPHRLSAADILVQRPEGSQRRDAELLRRALAEVGAPYRCASCGIGGQWRGKPLTLHVDHINGEFLDCRRENLRYLCPNCHSQTETYAGRNRRRYGGSGLPHVKRPTEAAWVTSDEDLAEVFRRVDSGAITTVQAVEQIGCSRGHYYRLRQRLAENGCAQGRSDARRHAREVRDRAIVDFALEHPRLSQKLIAAGLAAQSDGARRVAHGTVANVLRRAGLRYRADRERAAKRRPENEALESEVRQRQGLIVGGPETSCG